MCTVVVLRRPDHAWPLVLAANRDEMRDRPWQPPARHWPDRPHVVGGLDSLAGGTWMALNDDGVVAAVLNRMGSLGPAAGKRSRGELPLEALDHADAEDAARALADLDPAAYRPFNLIVADNRDAFWIAHRGTDTITVRLIAPGVHMISAHDMDDRTASPRIARHLSRFAAAPPPDPDRDDWEAWQVLLASRQGAGMERERQEGAMLVDTDFGFGTLCSALLALPAGPRQIGEPQRRPIWRFAAGRPDRRPFLPVALAP